MLFRRREQLEKRTNDGTGIVFDLPRLCCECESGSHEPMAFEYNFPFGELLCTVASPYFGWDSVRDFFARKIFWKSIILI